jgi:hypothetical protein
MRSTTEKNMDKKTVGYHQNLEPAIKALTLLDLPFQDKKLKQNETTWNNRDIAVKEMLRKINRYRMEELGRASMTGIALKQQAGEQWEIILANRRREYEEQQENMETAQREELQEKSKYWKNKAKESEGRKKKPPRSSNKCGRKSSDGKSAEATKKTPSEESDKGREINEQ